MQWISVDERLPDPGQHGTECIVATADGQVFAMAWRANRYATTERGRAPRWVRHDRISPWRVTHWMPMPKPPAKLEP